MGSGAVFDLGPHRDFNKQGCKEAMANPYSKFGTRHDYLEHLAGLHALPVAVVVTRADILGEAKDFDALPKALKKIRARRDANATRRANRRRNAITIDDPLHPDRT